MTPTNDNTRKRYGTEIITGSSVMTGDTICDHHGVVKFVVEESAPSHLGTRAFYCNHGDGRERTIHLFPDRRLYRIAIVAKI